jgi:hypothetical protein
VQTDYSIRCEKKERFGKTTEEIASNLTRSRGVMPDRIIIIIIIIIMNKNGNVAFWSVIVHIYSEAWNFSLTRIRKESLSFIGTVLGTVTLHCHFSVTYRIWFPSLVFFKLPPPPPHTHTHLSLRARSLRDSRRTENTWISPFVGDFCRLCVCFIWNSF